MVSLIPNCPILIRAGTEERIDQFEVSQLGLVIEIKCCERQYNKSRMSHMQLAHSSNKHHSVGLCWKKQFLIHSRV